MGSTGDSCRYGSAKYFALCALAGTLPCSLTHTALTPLDLIKCRMQVNPNKYRSVVRTLFHTIREDGLRGLVRGWAPTAIGYSLQGLTKFGLYEVFKVLYSRRMGEEGAYLHRTSLYFKASASAEFFADIVLCPMEACKVRIQTQDGCPRELRKVAPMILKTEGIMGFYKGLVPLWSRQIPYTMMKFASFERTLEFLYKYIVPRPKELCSKWQQLAVTFTAGYIAGILCAIISHPADTVVSKLYQKKDRRAITVLWQLGFRGLWRGLVPRIVMIGTLTGVEWFIYDGAKVWMRVPRPPPPHMPDSLKRKLKYRQQ